MADVKEFTDDNFEAEVLQSPLPVLVDFWAPWCGPCRQLTPMVTELAAENEGSVVVGKVNVDDCEQLAVKYGISSIPAIFIFKGGEVVDRVIGVQPKIKLQDLLDSVAG